MSVFHSLDVCLTPIQEIEFIGTLTLQFQEMPMSSSHNVQEMQLTFVINTNTTLERVASHPIPFFPFPPSCYPLLPFDSPILLVGENT